MSSGLFAGGEKDSVIMNAWSSNLSGDNLIQRECLPRSGTDAICGIHAILSLFNILRGSPDIHTCFVQLPRRLASSQESGKHTVKKTDLECW